MDEKKRYGILTALAKAIGTAAKEEPDVLSSVRGAADVDAYEAVLVQHRGNLPEALVREYARGTPPDALKRERAKLVLSAKMVMKGEEPVSAKDAERGPVRGR